MKEEVIKLIGNELESINVFIDDVYLEKEGNQNYLRVVIDANDVIDIDRVVQATKIIDPAIEKADLVKDEYILDVYAKSKGDD
jgi:ribosome maturation factor RimP